MLRNLTRRLIPGDDNGAVSTKDTKTDASVKRRALGDITNAYNDDASASNQQQAKKPSFVNNSQVSMGFFDKKEKVDKVAEKEEDSRSYMLRYVILNPPFIAKMTFINHCSFIEDQVMISMHATPTTHFSAPLMSTKCMIISVYLKDNSWSKATYPFNPISMKRCAASLWIGWSKSTSNSRWFLKLSI